MTNLPRPSPPRSPGVLITFEGPDGSGKSTQIERLGERLRGTGLAVELTREPKGTTLGEAIFGLHSLRPEPLAELFLMLAQRAQHVAEKLRPWLDAGRVVLCDRFIDTSVTYQGYGRGLGSCMVRTLNAHAAGHIVPLISRCSSTYRRTSASRGSATGASTASSARAPTSTSACARATSR